MHGGKAGRRASVGTYTGGFAVLGERYIQLKQNRDKLYDLDQVPALLLHVAERSVERAKELDTPELRAQGIALFEDFERNAQSDPDAASAALRKLGALLRRGSEEDSALQQAVRDAKAYQREAVRVCKLWLDRQSVLTQDQVDGLMAGIATVVADASPTASIAERILGAMDLAFVAASSRKARGQAIAARSGIPHLPG